MKSTGITFLGFLSLIFIGLKLAEVGAVAGWSWWWVLAPIWIPAAAVASFAAAIALVVYSAVAIEKVWRR